MGFITDLFKSETDTTVQMPQWQEDALREGITNLQGAGVPQLNPDNMTAGMNPWLMESLAGAANYATGAGADQVAMMNAMGLGQAGTAEQMEALAGLQAQYGDMALSGAGGWIMNELMANMSDAKKGGGGSSMMMGGGGGGGGGFGGGGTTLGGDLKFKYDQGTFDQSYNNLIGSAQGAFDSWSNKTKTNNLFENLPGLKIGSQMLGGANTKVGQNASLLDALTNQQITDYGAQMQQWASGTADANAMRAGQGNQQTAMGKYQTDVNAATSRANAAMSAATSAANARLAADTQRYGALVGAAGNMFGYGSGLLGDASTSLANANTGYGQAADTFGNANTQAINNLDTSLAAGDYVQKYDQMALTNWNNANKYNMETPYNMQLDFFNAVNGIPTGSNTDSSPGLMQAIGQIGSMGMGFGLWS
jgi:hypothetical protein